MNYIDVASANVGREAETDGHVDRPQRKPGGPAALAGQRQAAFFDERHLRRVRRRIFNIITRAGFISR
jgi:hypothetical protein